MQELHDLCRGPNDEKELRGLARVDTYDEDSFSQGHSEFKMAHNAAFGSLAAHCNGLASTAAVFYLDGPRGRTTQSLLALGFDRRLLFTANWHKDTCAALKASPHRVTNVIHARAEDALGSADMFAQCRFDAVYLDGCGGATKPIAESMKALFADHRRDINPERMAIGFTLTEAEPTGRSLANREMDLHRSLAALCRSRGYRMEHVSDAPTLYGVDEGILKKDGGTLTSWHVCVRL